MRKKSEGRLWVDETPTLEVIFVTVTENSSAIKNDTQLLWEYPRDMVLKVPWYFYSTIFHLH